MLGAFMCFYREKSKVQIRPYSIKSVRLVLKGLSALREVVDNPVHNILWLNVLSGWSTSIYCSNLSSLLSYLIFIYLTCTIESITETYSDNGFFGHILSFIPPKIWNYIL